MQYYISLPELAEKPGAVELSQVATLSHQRVPNPVLLELVMNGDDTSAYPPDELELANIAVERIGEAIEDAQSLIDGYLRQRGYKLPFTRVPRLLTTWCRAITRYYLHQHRLSVEQNDPIVRDYRDALKLLQQVADGKLSLGVDDTLPSGGGKPMISTPGRTFSLKTLKDYGQ